MSDTPQGFDLATTQDISAREDAGLLVELVNENDEPLEYVDAVGKTQLVSVRVAGTYSSTYRRALQGQKDQMIKKRRAQLTTEQLDQQQLELTAACVLGWDGFTNAGEPFPCTPANKVMVLDRAPWIRRQIEAAQNDHAAFFRNSSTS